MGAEYCMGAPFIFSGLRSFNEIELSVDLYNLAAGLYITLFDSNSIGSAKFKP